MGLSRAVLHAGRPPLPEVDIQPGKLAGRPDQRGKLAGQPELLFCAYAYDDDDKSGQYRYAYDDDDKSGQYRYDVCPGVLSQTSS